MPPVADAGIGRVPWDQPDKRTDWRPHPDQVNSSDVRAIEERLLVHLSSCRGIPLRISKVEADGSFTAQQVSSSNPLVVFVQRSAHTKVPETDRKYHTQIHEDDILPTWRGSAATFHSVREDKRVGDV